MRRWLVCLACMPLAALAYDWEVEVGAEWRGFSEKGLDSQSRHHPSLYIQPEFYVETEQGQDSLFAQAFYRVDHRDAQRTHGDIRELIYTHVGDNWEVQLGIGKVFWGVAESRHLIDIINQTDLVENLDEEDKLGQPMIMGTINTDSGSFSGFLLPYFRERTYPGFNGRLRASPVVDNDLAIYQSSDKKKHLDWALRWAHTFDVWDVGLSVFHGTSREPRLIPSRIGLDAKFAPLYDIITQYSIDVQATLDAWLWKFEGLRRLDQGPNYNAMIGGFEYTLYGLFDGPKDLGLIAEYHYDSRGLESPQPFNDDFSLGFRLAFNDVASSEILAFTMIDRHLSTRVYRVEASRRLGQSMTISLEGSIVDNVDTRDPLYFLRKDDYIQLNLTYHFSNS